MLDMFLGALSNKESQRHNLFHQAYHILRGRFQDFHFHRKSHLNYMSSYNLLGILHYFHKIDILHLDMLPANIYNQMDKLRDVLMWNTFHLDMLIIQRKMIRNHHNILVVRKGHKLHLINTLGSLHIE